MRDDALDGALAQYAERRPSCQLPTSYLNATSRALIEDLYALDFDRFGFTRGEEVTEVGNMVAAMSNAGVRGTPKVRAAGDARAARAKGGKKRLFSGREGA